MCDIVQECVLLFLRAPELGKVKTRLAGVVGEELALEYYMGFVESELAMLSRGAFKTVICYHPPEKKALVQRWLGDGKPCIAQSGGDLGRRMANAFETVFREDCRRAVLIGSDIPDLPYEFVVRALRELVRNDAVIGPAEDGGYYLIGFAAGAYSRKFFEKMPWGSERVFEKTVDRFEQGGLRFHRLPPWNDIDDHRDLSNYLAGRRPDEPKN